MKILFLLVLLQFGVLHSCAREIQETPRPDETFKTIDLSGYQLTFSDEFDGNKMKWEWWEADHPNNIKNATSRGPEAVEVRDGELRLNVRLVNRSEKVKWIAGYVYLREPLENNTYIECRFRSGEASGVNNAFWLACKTPPNDTYRNRYEIDIVEARKDVGKNIGNGHLAWHDWKTYAYALDKNGNKADIAQGIVVPHDFDDYHVWGLWYGENELIYYLDGEEVWRGKTHPTYTDQYNTGVGKAPVWNPIEQQRAYGKYGQDDWSYLGGYNGDKMHIILANIPWHASWSPLVESEADGTWMAVDYVRIYKPKSMLVQQPDIDQPKAQIQTTLTPKYSLAEDGAIYISAEITKKPGEELTLTLEGDDGSAAGKVIVDAEGMLLTGITRLTSSKVAASSVQQVRLVNDNERTLLVCRITAHAAKGIYDKDAISVWCTPFAAAPTAKEPYFYPNFDENGNTSAGQGWYINQKGYSDEVISHIKLASTSGDLSSFGRVRAGRNFISVTR